MSIQEARQLNRHLFAAARWAFDLRGFSNISRHGDTYTTQELNSLRDGVHQFNLLVKMFVVEKVELIKGGPGNLPVRLLVQIAQGYAVCKQLVQLRGHLQPYRLFQFERKQVIYGSISLKFTGTLMKAGLGADPLRGVCRNGFFGHQVSPSSAIE